MFKEFIVITTMYVTSAMSELVILDRDSWHARPPKDTTPMPAPAPFVVIHHSYIPAACTTGSECVKAMQWMQDYHQNNHSWNDIGYHFAVGGDGNVYEGRGWHSVGAHSPGYNDIGIGICIIGDWREDLPPDNQLKAVNNLIDFGVQNQHIRDDYHLIAHRQVRDTECPGDRLFKEITTWKNFLPNPKKPCIEKKPPNVHGLINRIS